MSKVRLTRRVTFSSGHRYWDPALSKEENKALFGPWASPFNHGHNYALEVTTEGVVNPADGMVLNIKRIDDYLQKHIVSTYDQKSLNDEVPAYQSIPPTVENILMTIRQELSNLPSETKLVGLKLEETPTLHGELNETGPGQWAVSISRMYEFAASHRLHAPHLSDQVNHELFGKCNNAAGHGHNYGVEVTVSGIPDPKTGMIANILDIDQVVEALVVERYDHKNLNVDVPDFEGKMTTSEMVVLQIFENLKDA